jgi:hypothetical protein
MPDDSVPIRGARELATSVFAPAAMAVETSQRVPPEHLDLLAAEGFYGLPGPGPLDEQLARCRARLDTAGPEGMPGARAAACELASRAVAALVVSQGPGRSWPARMRSGWPGRPCSCWCSAPGRRSGRPLTGLLVRPVGPVGTVPG